MNKRIEYALLIKQTPLFQRGVFYFKDVLYICSIVKGKLILESFSPSLERAEFYYKPSKEWNNIVFSDFKYTDYFIRVYGNIPERVNPVKLSLMGDGGILFEDFKVDLPGEYLTGIIEKGGECSFKVEDDGIYLKGKKLEKCL